MPHFKGEISFFQGKLLLAFSAFGGYKLLRTYHRRIFPQDYNVAPTYIMLNQNVAFLQYLVRWLNESMFTKYGLLLVCIRILSIFRVHEIHIKHFFVILVFTGQNLIKKASLWLKIFVLWSYIASAYSYNFKTLAAIASCNSHKHQFTMRKFQCNFIPPQEFILWFSSKPERAKIQEILKI